MLNTLFHFSPLIVTFTVMMVYIIARNPRNPSFLTLCAVMIPFFAADALHSIAGVNYDVVVYADMTAQFLVFCMLPALSSFLYYERYHKMPRKIWLLLLIPAAIIGANIFMMIMRFGSSGISWYMECIDKADGHLPQDADFAMSYFYVSEIICTRVLVIIEFLASTVLLIMLLRDSSGRFKYICLSMALMFVVGMVRAMAGRQYLITHQDVSMLLTAALAGLVVIFGIVYFFKPENDTLQESEALLRHRFMYYMDEKKLYRDKSVGIEKLARLLGTNRAFLAEMLAHEFGMTYRRYAENRRQNDH